MDETPISEQDLQLAHECRLIEPDGTSWQVMDVTVEKGRAWVRARRDPEVEEESRPRLRVFDTVLSRSARLVWILPGGQRVVATSAEDGDLEWSVQGPGAENGLRAAEAEDGFFEDAFLAS